MFKKRGSLKYGIFNYFNRDFISSEKVKSPEVIWSLLDTKYLRTSVDLIIEKGGKRLYIFNRQKEKNTTSIASKIICPKTQKSNILPS